jgi:hypothetical protein
MAKGLERPDTLLGMARLLTQIVPTMRPLPNDSAERKKTVAIAIKEKFQQPQLAGFLAHIRPMLVAAAPGDMKWAAFLKEEHTYEKLKGFSIYKTALLISNITEAIYSIVVVTPGSPAVPMAQLLLPTHTVVQRNQKIAALTAAIVATPMQAEKLVRRQLLTISNW